MKARKRKTSDALEILHQRFYEGKPKRIAQLERERVNASIARQIFDLRTSAGLTQSELAGLIGTTASVISRLEDADYTGHSLAILRRIALALGLQVEIRFKPVGKTNISKRQYAKRSTGLRNGLRANA
jgi:ribosome-binding protein aMBF1 (putative translation factor)